MFKHKILYFIIVILLLTISTSYSQFYYSAGKQIPLRIDSTKITIKFDPGLSSIERQILIMGNEHIIHLT